MRLGLVSSSSVLVSLAASAVEIPDTPNAGAPSASPYLLVEMKVNGQTSQSVVEIVKVSAACDQIAVRYLNLAGLYNAPEAAVCLQDVPGIDYRIDTATATLEIFTRAEPELLAAPHHARPTFLRPTPGLLGSYSLSGQRVETENDTDWNSFGSLSLGFYAPAGRLENEVIASVTEDRSNVQRIRTVYQKDFPDSLTTLSLGDSFTRAPRWGRVTAFAGLQIGTDFSMDPEGNYMPFQMLKALLRDQSEVNIRINGVTRRHVGVDPGMTEFDIAPQTGLNEVEMVIREETGLTRIENFSFFNSRTALAKGRTDYSVSLGVPRRYVGAEAAYLDRVIGNAYLRRGLSNEVTGEVYLEASNEGMLAGTGAQLTTRHIGVLNVSAALSESDESGTGGLFAVGFERITRRTSLQLEARFAGDAYRDGVSANGVPFPDRTVRASVGVATGLGSLRASYQEEEDIDLRDRRFAALSWERPFESQRISAFASAYHDMEQDESGLSLGLRVRFGNNKTASLSRTQLDDDYANVLQVNGSSGKNDRLQWSAQATDGNRTDSVQAYGTLQGRQAEMFANVGLYESMNQASAGIRGGFAMAGGMLALRRYAGTSAALVNADGLENVDVFHDGRPAGQTNNDGRILIMDLRAHEANKLSLEPEDLSLDYAVETYEKSVRPMRGIVQVDFKARRALSLAFTIIQRDGSPLPVGSTVRILDTGELCPVGYDGRAWCEHILDGQTVEVVTPEGRFTQRADQLREDGVMRLIDAPSLRMASTDR